MTYLEYELGLIKEACDRISKADNDSEAKRLLDQYTRMPTKDFGVWIVDVLEYLKKRVIEK
jgi:hypothetical protein